MIPRPRTSIARLPWLTAASAIVIVLLAAAISAGHAYSQSRNAAQIAKQGGIPTTRAERAIVMDAESGSVLFQHNADELAPPASMSKLMTLAVVFRAIKAGELKLDEDIRISANAWRRGGAPSRTSAMLIPVNTKEKLDLLIQGIIVQSGNDATMAIAEAMAGNEDNFARLMIDEARRIGLTKSTFGNSTGLPHPQQLMTARELALLARHLMKEYPEHYSRFAQKELSYRTHKFFNRNNLLGVGGVDGMKTGQIAAAGFGVVASANRDGRRLILVLSGLEKREEVKTEGEKLLDWGFASLAEVKLFEAGEIVGEARVWGGDRMWVPVVGKGPITVVLPKHALGQKLKAEMVYKRPLKTPIAKGDRVGTLRVTTAAKSVSEAPLYAAEDVKPGGMVRRGIDTIVHLAIGWAL